MSSSQGEPDSDPATDEEISAFTVGEVVPLDAPITLVEYDPVWPQLFTREEKRIRTALGNMALRVEHVG